MRILGISGSPSRTSKTSMLVRLVLDLFSRDGFETEYFDLRSIDPTALMHGDFKHPEIGAWTSAVERAHGVIIGTPIYKAAYAGLLKAGLDMLPQFGLAGKVVLPLGTGGSLAHVLALDYGLRPVLQSMGARHIVQAQFVCESDIRSVDPFEIAGPVQETLSEAIRNFRHSLTDDFSAQALGHPRPENDMAGKDC